MMLYEREVMHELQELLEDEFADLLQAYIQDVNTKVAEIEALKLAEDWPAIRHLAHSLKGSSINLGIEEFSRQCGDMEIHAKNNDAAKLAVSMQCFSENAQALIDSLQADFLS